MYKSVPLWDQPVLSYGDESPWTLENSDCGRSGRGGEACINDETDDESLVDEDSEDEESSEVLDALFETETQESRPRTRLTESLNED